MVQALERVSPQSENGAFEDALQLLKHAVSECGELGDAWYYRSLVEQRLGHDALAKYAMEKAHFLGSEAMEEGLNPLVLSTPGRRGLGVEEGTAEAPVKVATRLGPVRQKWALVVGISRFGDGSIPRLNYTTADANAFADELKDPGIGRFKGSNVHVLTDDQATTKNIKEQLNWIARHAEPNDMVVIYVATHGTPRTMDSAGGANYLVTYDTEVSNSGSFDQDAMYATAYPMVELADAVATRMKAMRTAVILDTCYSGGSMKAEPSSSSAQLADKPPSNQMLARMIQGTGRIVLAASQVDEESMESAELAAWILHLLPARCVEEEWRKFAVEPGVCRRSSTRVAARLGRRNASASRHEQEFGGRGLRAGSGRKRARGIASLVCVSRLYTGTFAGLFSSPASRFAGSA